MVGKALIVEWDRVVRWLVCEGRVGDELGVRWWWKTTLVLVFAGWGEDGE